MQTKNFPFPTHLPLLLSSNPYRSASCRTSIPLHSHFCKLQFEKMIFPLLCAVLLALLPQIRSETLTSPSNIQTQIFTLYPLSNISIQNPYYSLTFSSSNFSTLPAFAYSVNDFKAGNTLAYQYFFTYALNLTSKSVIIQVITDNTTKVYKLSISYMAAWSMDSLFVISKSYSNMSNISTGSNTRYYRVFEVYPFSTDNVTALAFLRGYFFTSTVAAKIYVYASVISIANYQVYIQTSADCLVKNVVFDILFYYPAALTSQSYYYTSDFTSLNSPNPNPTTYTRTLSNYNKSSVIIGFYGVYAYSVLLINMGWSVSNISDSTATLLINKANIQNLYYSYFQIWVVKQAVYNTNSQSAVQPEKTSYLGIIGGLIGGVAVVAVGVVLFIKWYFKNTIYIIPQKDDFRMLPAISV